MAGLFSKLFGMEDNSNLKTLLANGAILLDVRTQGEYKQGHGANSVNIPLDVLSSNLSKLDKNKPIIVVCASGMRSSSATSLLKKNGFTEVHNGGGWTNFR